MERWVKEQEKRIRKEIEGRIQGIERVRKNKGVNLGMWNEFSAKPEETDPGFPTHPAQYPHPEPANEIVWGPTALL
jgi:hypothetical protein